jgi:ribosomal protein L30/L7E
MIFNGSAQVLLNLKKNNNKQSLKINPGIQKKLGMLNVIKQLQHFI